MIKKQVNILIFCLTGILQLLSNASYVESQIHYDGNSVQQTRLPVGVPDTGVIRNLRKLVETEPEARELWQKLQIRAESYLSEEPRPIESINYEGMLSNHPDRVATLSHLYDMMRVEIWLSAWLIETMEREFRD